MYLLHKIFVFFTYINCDNGFGLRRTINISVKYNWLLIVKTDFNLLAG